MESRSVVARSEASGKGCNYKEMACRSFPVVLLLPCILMVVVVTEIYPCVKIHRSVHLNIQFYSRLTLRIRMEIRTISQICTKEVDITEVESREASGDPHGKE